MYKALDPEFIHLLRTVRSQSSHKRPTDQRRHLDALRVNPDPRLVALVDFAIDQLVEHLEWNKARYEPEWFTWAAEWKRGYRSPARCVDVAHRCFDHRGWGPGGKSTDPVHHALGQIAWAGKEACYNGTATGWLVVRYIADAMHACGIALPEKPLPLLEDCR